MTLDIIFSGIYFAEHSSKSNQYIYGIGGGTGCPAHKDRSCYICHRWDNSRLATENTHLPWKGKYHCTLDLLFHWLGFDQTNKSVVNLTLVKQLNPNEYSDTFSYKVSEYSPLGTFQLNSFAMFMLCNCLLVGMELWRLVRALVVSCCVNGKPLKSMQHMHGNIPLMFDCWADPIFHMLLLKNS